MGSLRTDLREDLGREPSTEEIQGALSSFRVATAYPLLVSDGAIRTEYTPPPTTPMLAAGVTGGPTAPAELLTVYPTVQAGMHLR